MLILASTSPYRKRQLVGLGLRFETMASGVDEAPFQQRAEAGELSPKALAEQLARSKAVAVLASHPEAVVIGGDQVGYVPSLGQWLNKPGTFEAAVAQLTSMAGRVHELWTAVAVCTKKTQQTFVDRTELSMRALSSVELRRYVERDQPLDCAGSYKFEAGGAALFEQVKTQDPTAITGLPLIALVRLLDAAGIACP